MKLKKQHLIILAVLILVVSVSSVVLMLNTENGHSPTGNGDVVETGDWIDLSSNINAVATDCGFGYTDYSDVFFINENEGWVTSSCVPEIYHTADGGESWEVQTTQFPCNAIWMLNENEGYAGGSEGRLYRTTDGGNNWNVHGSIGTTLTDITFPPQPADTGYCCGFSGTMFTITSSGINKMENTEWSTVNMAAISFPTESEGWVVGEQVMDHYKDGVWKMDQSLPYLGLTCIFFIDNTNGWAVGSNRWGQSIIHTVDGQNWETQTNPNNSEVLLDVYFLDENEGWIVGNSGLVMHTTNGGAVWTIEAEGLAEMMLRGVHFPSSSVGYVCGNEGKLLKYVAED